jgi:hypothetical protein
MSYSDKNLLKRCNIDFIEGLVSRYNRGGDMNNIKAAMEKRALEIVSMFNIKDCITIISKYENIHDIYSKIQSSDIDISDKLNFHKQITLICLMKLIEKRFNSKILI